MVILMVPSKSRFVVTVMFPRMMVGEEMESIVSEMPPPRPIPSPSRRTPPIEIVIWI